MKSMFYPKLAWMGIRKNSRLYIPYILASMGMVMMYYIVAFLNTSSALQSVPGGDVMQSMLGFGMYVIVAFSLLFLFYTNSFLNRRRKKEFGLYNILGMGKWNLAKILVCESVMSAVISMGGGLLAGITFSKFAELGMVNLLMGETKFSFSLGAEAILETLKWFSIIFLVILLQTLWQIRGESAMELLHSENAGEKPPKANWLLALTGLVILAAAYYLAVSIENPIEALIWFFVAVIMVIVATYLLFIAGSVTICRILQKNKSYYYKTRHFVSISSMIYRMKRNGAGLASICILCTMVLVMLSGTVCLYAGTEDSLRNRYPRNIMIDASFRSMEAMESGVMDRVREAAGQAVSAEGDGTLITENVLDYPLVDFSCIMAEGQFRTHDENASAFQMSDYADAWQIFLVPLEDYNRMMDQKEALAPGEVLIYTTKRDYEKDTITVNDGEAMRIKKVVPEFVQNGVDAEQIIPTMFIFVPDLAEAARPLEGLVNEWGNPVMGFRWNYGFDLDCGDEMQMRILDRAQAALEHEMMRMKADQDALDGTEETSPFLAYSRCAAKERATFYGLYGSLFFLGILLGVVFVFAAVLIIYYKQISEGYEDQARFEIMQKVGMTETDIRRSVNSQVLTVFFLPLIMAGIHLAFAFPMVHKLLLLFSLTNLKLLLIVTVCCYLVFAVFYMMVYRITSRGYYHIVSMWAEKK
nr:ABC transporter permease [uncultured Schaedlerella sp.]